MMFFGASENIFLQRSRPLLGLVRRAGLLEMLKGEPVARSVVRVGCSFYCSNEMRGLPAHRENRTLSETDATVTSSVLRLPFVKSGADRRDIFASAVREDAPHRWRKQE